MNAVSPEQARRFWAVAETLHAVTYFDDSCTEAMTAAGTKGFWMSYFVGRLAPMGHVGPEVATAVCGSFAPTRPARALPDGWGLVPPERALEIRSGAAADSLRRHAVDIERLAIESEDTLGRLVDGLSASGRPLGQANMGLELPPDPVERFWQRCTTVREHRGDAHVALLVAAGLDGCAANVVPTAAHGWDPSFQKRSRDWSDEDWDAAVDRLRRRGVLDDNPDQLVLSPRGADLLLWVERRTDELACASYGTVSSSHMAELIEAFGPSSASVSESVITYPNPMGLDPT